MPIPSNPVGPDARPADPPADTGGDLNPTEPTGAARPPDDPAPAFGPPAAPGDLGRLAHYRVHKELGRGGMGAVYLGFDEGLRRKVALKVMLPRSAADPHARERFLREARAAAAVKHDHVVTIYQVGEDAGTPFIAMEYLDGYPLDEYLRRKDRLSIPQVLRVGREAAAGLAAAHALGLVHRDIKPANLWLESPNGRIKILDFGLAKATAGAGDAAAAEVTGSGVVVGTPQYMSPEQARGLPVDARTDVFSLGAVLYRLCTGRLPFTGPTVMAVLTALAVEDPPPVLSLAPDVPSALADLIHRMLAKRPEDRPQTADEVLAILRAIRRGAGDPSPSDDGAAPAVVYVPIPVTMAEPNAFAGLDDTPSAVAEAPKPPRPRSGGYGLWAAAALAVVIATGLGYVGVSRLRTVPPPPEPPPRLDPKPDPPPTDPDREVAKWALKLGSRVTVNGVEMNALDQLPDGPLRLTRLIVTGSGVPVRDGDLDRLERLSSLDVLHLSYDSDITNKGLERLAGCRFANGLSDLAVRCPGVTEAGLAHLRRFRSLQRLHIVGLAKPTSAAMAQIGNLTELDTLMVAEVSIPGGAWAPLSNTKLTTLSLSRCQLSDDGLLGLRKVATLGTLNLHGSKLSVETVKPLAGHPAISTLNLNGSSFPDNMLAAVRDLPALGSLSLVDTTVGDKGIAHLAGLIRLGGLSLSGTRVTDEGLAAVGQILTLEYLDLQGMPFTDAGVRHLAGLKNLSELRLDRSRITDASMPTLAGLQKLRVVNLTGTAITDAGIGKLSAHKFSFLHLGGTKVTSDGVKKLRAALPDCQIASDFDGK
jgi:serine/threonine protein kinase